ncbi:hypothetical protein [Burkholderia sp. AU31652]|uniref:hypothetical protein n=1 Tax=Burkholderia sp. AU31652 TaxID=2015354 RepID=UPI001177954D|nr:hypothetical protein [Burkholderia sp. AU31652]
MSYSNKYESKNDGPPNVQTPDKPLRHRVDKFIAPAPIQAIRKSLFFTQKYLTSHSDHSRSICVQVWLAAISPKRTLDGPNGSFWKSGPSPATASTESQKGYQATDGVFGQ